MTAVLRVDLDRLADNLARIRARVAPAEHMLVVKDDAYGHGLRPVVRRAHAEGVRWFGAFDVATGVAVREELGPDVRIFIWIAASRADVAEAIAHRLDLGIGDGEMLAETVEAARAASVPARVHLKIDSGLHRNGFRPEEWDAAVATARRGEADRSLDVVGIWSHLAEASDAEDDAAAAVFDAACRTAVAAGLEPRIRHLTASAASFLRPELRGDLVRVGAFAYGIRPAGGPDEAELGVRGIATLAAPVVAVGEDTVRIGAGSLHGIPSILAGRVALASPAGPCPLLRVDAFTSEVQRWPEALVGDEVVVYGDGGPSATDLAEAIGTIGEEIALRVSPRVPRIWEGEVSRRR